MIDGLAFALTVSCVGTGLLVLARGGRGRFRRARVTPTLVALEIGLVVQAGLDVVGLVRGHRLAEPSTHLAYLTMSVVVVPVVAVQTNGDDGRWSATLLGVVLLVAAVLVVRLATTWHE